MVKALKIIFSSKKEISLFILHLHQQQKYLISFVPIFKL